MSEPLCKNSHLLDLSIHHSLVLDLWRLAPRNKEEAMVPSRVVPHILLNQLLSRLQLSLVPKFKPAHQPLSVAPHVVVLCIQFEHLRDEVCFAFARVQAVHDELTVMPNLVVLLVVESGLVEPF